MNFITHVVHEIDKIGIGNFDENGKKNTVLDINVCVFLKSLNDLEVCKNVLMPKSKFDLASTEIGRLILHKTDKNSINDQVNPKFLNKLKNYSINYMNILSTTKWREWSHEEKTLIQNSRSLDCSSSQIDGITTILNGTLSTHYIFDIIRKTRGIPVQIFAIISPQHKDFVVGKKEDLASFQKALLDEYMVFQKIVKSARNLPKADSSV